MLKVIFEQCGCFIHPRLLDDLRFMTFLLDLCYTNLYWKFNTNWTLVQEPKNIPMCQLSTFLPF